MYLLRIVAAVLAIGGVTAAAAADLGAPRGPVGYPAYAAPPPIWSGFYLGVHAGYGNSHASGVTFDGFLGGGQVGYNFTMAQNIILGLEADVSGADLSKSQTAFLFGIPATATTRTWALGTVRGRVGAAFGQFLIYGTGGFAWAVNDLSGSVGGFGMSDTRTHTGFTVGAGGEWMIAPAWSLRAEYLYANFGSRTYFNGTVPSGDIDTHIVRLGVNYLFR
jgi:outer membrane immunogenic protein